MKERFRGSGVPGFQGSGVLGSDSRDAGTPNLWNPETGEPRNRGTSEPRNPETLVMVRKRLAPRLVTRALLASFLTVAVILGAVFVLLTLDMRQRVRQTVAANLDAGQQVFAQVEGRREEQMVATVSTLAENPTLKAALDTWQLERRAGGSDGGGVATVENELKKIAGRVGADVLAIVDRRGEIVASAGPRAPAFRPGLAIKTRADETSDRGDAVVTMPAGVFRVIGVPLLLEDVVIGTLAAGYRARRGLRAATGGTRRVRTARS